MTAAAAIARRKSTAASLSSATDGAARPEAASATADQPTHRDPHAAGAQFASTAAGIATAALDRWLKSKRASAPAASDRPPTAGTPHSHHRFRPRTAPPARLPLLSPPRPRRVQGPSVLVAR